MCKCNSQGYGTSDCLGLKNCPASAQPVGPYAGYFGADYAWGKEKRKEDGKFRYGYIKKPADAEDSDAVKLAKKQKRREDREKDSETAKEVLLRDVIDTLVRQSRQRSNMVNARNIKFLDARVTVVRPGGNRNSPDAEIKVEVFMRPEAFTTENVNSTTSDFFHKGMLGLATAENSAANRDYFQQWVKWTNMPDMSVVTVSDSSTLRRPPQHDLSVTLYRRGFFFWYGGVGGVGGTPAIQELTCG